MRVRHALLTFAVIQLAGRCPAALGWNGTGHEVVALIAWDQLTPAQRQMFTQMLRAHPRYGKDLMQNLARGEDPAEHAFREAATWPDQVKNPTNPLQRAEDHHAWHYVDFPYDRDGKAGPSPAGRWDGQAVPADLVQAMQMVTAQLRDPVTPAPRKALDLCWVIHLAGDIHQPLHAVTEYSNAYPTGDQGGNLIHVASPDNPDTNLHALWDGIEGRSYDASVIRQTASRIEKGHPRSSVVTALAVTDPLAWAHESFDVARHSVYLDGRISGVTREQASRNPGSIPPLPVGYERRAQAVADGQIAVAGYRLAGLLRSVASPATRP